MFCDVAVTVAARERLARHGLPVLIVEHGVRDGTLRPVDPMFTHLSLVGSLLFFFATAPFRERLASMADSPLPARPAAEYVRHVQELIARGLAADARPSATLRANGAGA